MLFFTTFLTVTGLVALLAAWGAAGAAVAAGAATLADGATGVTGASDFVAPASVSGFFSRVCSSFWRIFENESIPRKILKILRIHNGNKNRYNWPR